MKSLLTTLLFVAFLSSSSLMAQELGIGIKAGVAQSNLWNEAGNDFTPLNTFHVGLVFRQQLTDR